MGPEWQAEVPEWQAEVPAISEDDPRGGVLMSNLEVERTLAVQTARRLTAAAFQKKGARFGSENIKSAATPVCSPVRARCGTFGCTLPDRHPGLHQARLCTYADIQMTHTYA